jgi:hypothetical protein
METERSEGERAECGCSLVYGELHVDELRPPARFLAGLERKRSKASPWCSIWVGCWLRKARGGVLSRSRPGALRRRGGRCLAGVRGEHGQEQIDKEASWGCASESWGVGRRLWRGGGC